MVGVTYQIKAEHTNTAVVGQRLDQMRDGLKPGRFGYVVVGSTGINDCRETTTEIITRWHHLVSAIRVRYPRAKIVSFGIPPNTGVIPIDRRAVNSAVAASVDCFVSTDEIVEVAPDGYHMTARGSAFILEGIRTCGVPL